MKLSRWRSGLIALTAVVGLLTAAPLTASAGPSTGPACVGGEFKAIPGEGTAIAPGGLIVYQLRVEVQGGLVLGCARDIRLSPLLEFVRAWPAGYHWPEIGISGVRWDGPYEPGTKLSGYVYARVRRDAPGGAVIESSSESTIRHVVRTIGTR